MKRTPFQGQLKYDRKIMRMWQERLARKHHCSPPRGCACVMERAMAVLEAAESQLFQLEIESFSVPIQSTKEPK